ncbi:hypothetical protein LCGC14_0334450 [marine sediment metagenome]|uniref:Uncharacterized protein n=1 Tax=marine sediment metagenome TaxID=412755 RepID=A0A0F9TY99_9ZZZZ
MPKTGFVMDRGWQRLDLAFDGRKFKGVARKHLRLAAERNGKLALGAVRRGIRRGGFEGNAELTEHIKGSGKKPLVDSGTRLFQGLTSEVQSDDKTVFIGFLLADRNFEAAAAIHEGAVIKVSQAMRDMFRLLWMVSVGNMIPERLTGRAAELWGRRPGGWLPLKPSTKVIIIPARPFIKRAFEEPKLRAAVKRQWEQAIQRSLKAQSKGKSK